MEENVEALTDLIENKLPQQHDTGMSSSDTAVGANLVANIEAEDAFVAERQQHRQKVLGSIHQVKARMEHLQEKGGYCLVK